ncbi:MAG: hypothetical protein WCE57_09130 [Salegentibacter sp.]
MKYFLYTIILFAIALIGYNFTILDFNSLMEGNSAKALLAILGSLCVIVLMVILLISRTISEKQKS